MTFVTVTFVRVMLPLFDTTPLMMSVPPGGTGLGGQLLLTVIEGELVPGQSLKSVAVTMRPKHLSAPDASTGGAGDVVLAGAGELAGT